MQQRKSLNADRNAAEPVGRLCSWFPCLPRGWPGFLLAKKRRHEKHSCLNRIKSVTPDRVAIKSLAIQLLNYVAAKKKGGGGREGDSIFPPQNFNLLPQENNYSIQTLNN